MFQYKVEPLKPDIKSLGQIISPNRQSTTPDFERLYEPLFWIGVFLLLATIGANINKKPDEELSRLLLLTGCVICFISLPILYFYKEYRSNLDDKFNSESDIAYRYNLAIEYSKNEAIETSEYLNRIISKSAELVNKVIPYYIDSINQNLNFCNYHLKKKAINNYFDSIEETVRDIACFKDVIDDVILNIKKYSIALTGREHNFPSKFPVSIEDININNQLEQLSKLNYQADTTPEFALVYNQRKLIEVNIAGFANLREGIDFAADKVADSISELKYEIRDSHDRLINIQQRQIDAIKTFSKLQEEYRQGIHEQLNSIDTKLYYIQYNKKPLTPFARPLFED